MPVHPGTGRNHIAFFIHPPGAQNGQAGGFCLTKSHGPGLAFGGGIPDHQGNIGLFIPGKHIGDRSQKGLMSPIFPIGARGFIRFQKHGIAHGRPDLKGTILGGSEKHQSGHGAIGCVADLDPGHRTAAIGIFKTTIFPQGIHNGLVHRAIPGALVLGNRIFPLQGRFQDTAVVIPDVRGLGGQMVGDIQGGRAHPVHRVGIIPGILGDHRRSTALGHHIACPFGAGDPVHHQATADAVQVKGEIIRGLGKIVADIPVVQTGPLQQIFHGNASGRGETVVDIFFKNPVFKLKERRGNSPILRINGGIDQKVGNNIIHIPLGQLLVNGLNKLGFGHLSAGQFGHGIVDMGETIGAKIQTDIGNQGRPVPESGTGEGLTIGGHKVGKGGVFCAGQFLAQMPGQGIKIPQALAFPLCLEIRGFTFVEIDPGLGHHRQFLFNFLVQGNLIFLARCGRRLGNAAGNPCHFQGIGIRGGQIYHDPFHHIMDIPLHPTQWITGQIVDLLAHGPQFQYPKYPVIHLVQGHPGFRTGHGKPFHTKAVRLNLEGAGIPLQAQFRCALKYPAHAGFKQIRHQIGLVRFRDMGLDHLGHGFPAVGLVPRL